MLYLYVNTELKIKKILLERKYILWTDGYFCSTIGEVSSKTLEKYIQNQG